MHNREIKRSRGSANKRMHLQRANWHSQLMEGDRQRCTSPNRLSKLTLARLEPSTHEWEISLARDHGRGALHWVNCPEILHDINKKKKTGIKTKGTPWHSIVKTDRQCEQNEAENTNKKPTRDRKPVNESSCRIKITIASCRQQNAHKCTICRTTAFPSARTRL